MTTTVQISSDKEIGAYQVFLMTEEGCKASVIFEYEEMNRGEAFAKAQKMARDWADENKCQIETNW